MFLCVIFVSMAIDDVPWHVADTELFQVMLLEEVFVQANGEAYVLHFDEGRVQYYGADGKLIKYIGSKGKGPGEFTFPIYITVVGGHLYIYDELTSKVSVFTDSGNYKGTIEPPSQNMELVRAKGGWFFWGSQTAFRETTSSVLEWGPGDFEERISLFEIANTGWGSGITSMSRNGKASATYSPLEARPIMAVSPDGARCYFADPLAFHIRVLDGASGRELYVINRDEKPIPFDEEWADELYKERARLIHERRPGLKIKKLYPETFPGIRGMSFDFEGNLIVDRWRGRPDHKHYYVAYDGNGKEVPVKHSYEVLRRLAGKVGGYGYLLMFNEEDGAGLARVPLAELEEFAQANPVSDWSTSRTISMPSPSPPLR